MRPIIKMFAVFTLLLANFTFVCNGQTNNNKGVFWGELEGGYGLTMAKIANSYPLPSPISNNVSSLQLALGYYLFPQLSLGVSTGIVGMLNPGLNYVPIYLDIRSLPFEKPILLNFKIGTQLKTNESELKPDLSLELMGGYTILNAKSFSITPCIGYHFVNYSINHPLGGDTHGSRNAIMLKLKFGLKT